MNIRFQKKNSAMHLVTVTRSNSTTEKIELHTQTFFLHDLVHYAVEKALSVQDGFWGMIAQGHAVSELRGKDNPLTEQLRGIEKIVGPVQAFHAGYMSREMLLENLKLAPFDLTHLPQIDAALTEIQAIMDRWQYLPIGQPLVLEL